MMEIFPSLLHEVHMMDMLAVVTQMVLELCRLVQVCLSGWLSKADVALCA